MMSPTTVAELLPRDSEQFDVVIIDEASQMLPCDALGAIARGRQAVIVGDPKQLPPSTYFQGSAAAAMGDDDEDAMLAPMVESILDLSLSAGIRQDICSGTIVRGTAASSSFPTRVSTTTG